MLNASGSGEPRSARKLAPRGTPAAPRRQSLLRLQARSALLPAATPRVRADRPRSGVDTDAGGPKHLDSLRCPAVRTLGRTNRAKPHHAGGRRGKEREASLRAEQRLAAGGRRGKERGASLRAEQRLAAGGRRLPRPGPAEQPRKPGVP